ncbi:MAG TPA: hypothetical protein VGD91_00355, partial [Trebonia sp.]
PVSNLPGGENTWVSLVIRGGALLTVTSDTTFQPGDDVLVLTDPGESGALDRYFTGPGPGFGPGPGADPGPGSGPSPGSGPG